MDKHPAGRKERTQLLQQQHQQQQQQQALQQQQRQQQHQLIEHPAGRKERTPLPCTLRVNDYEQPQSVIRISTCSKSHRALRRKELLTFAETPNSVAVSAV
ncbi:hypothetical protein PHET_07397 [Paragonimus heterotremus]|uniref:Uncharacterized protein n=1 Tax=Paragonimus heterotremus TaxID=100268 RepID=A0A8J4SVF9_9TREM|nr:hypothetical protein PHET_07397 [Paragonimus heterotremus]